MKSDHDYLQISVRVPIELKDRLERQAAAEDRPLANHIRRVLDRASAEPVHGEAA